MQFTEQFYWYFTIFINHKIRFEIDKHAFFVCFPDGYYSLPPWEHEWLHQISW